MGKSKANDVVSLDSIIRESAGQKKALLNFSKTYPAYIILAVALAISFLIFSYLREKVDSDNQQVFDKAVSSVMTRLERKHQTNVEIIQQLQGVYKSLTMVVKDFFDLYASVPANTYPSVVSICYAPLITPKTKDDREFDMQRAGILEFKVYPEGKRSDYFPIFYIVPQKKNYHLFGKDLAYNPVVREAIEKARDSNMFVSTPVIDLRGNDSLGFYVIAPVYYKDSAINSIELRKKHFMGAVVLESDVNIFFEEALATNRIASDTSIIFFGIEESLTNKIYYTSTNYDLSKFDYDKLEQTQILHIADKTFTIRFATIPGFGSGFQQAVPTIVLILSLIISFAFSGFVLSVITSRARALDLAERMTRSQRRIVDMSNDIIAVLDFDGKWKSMNPISEQLFGFKPISLIGKSVGELLVNSNELAPILKRIRSFPDSSSERIDVLMKGKDAQEIWVSWNLNVSKEDRLIYTIGRDVSLEKKAEEEERLKSKQIQLAEQFTKEASEYKSLFMTKLSHQLRNSLTGIIGYLQLISQKIYETEEERDSFVELAEQSSEELFTFVSDIVDVAQGGDGEYKELAAIPINATINELGLLIKEETRSAKEIIINILEDSQDITVLGDYSLVLDSLKNVLLALSEGVEKIVLDVNASANPHEGAAELQILSGPNKLVSEMIELYKKHSADIIGSLKQDKNDVMLNLAMAKSKLQTISGTMSVESFGAEEGNLVQISMPINKQIES